MTVVDALQHDGFVIIRQLLPADQVAALHAAAAAVTARARASVWPFVRTVPKQFPPWPTAAEAADGIWGVQHLLHPDIGPERAEFARVYFAPEVLGPVEELLGLRGAAAAAGGERGSGSGSSSNHDHAAAAAGTKSAADTNRDANGAVNGYAAGGDEKLVMELFNLLVAPDNHPFRLRWHRDDVPESASPTEEARLLALKSPGGRQFHAQYNIALCPDASLVVVPGSHRRVRTDAERAATATGAAAAAAAAAATGKGTTTGPTMAERKDGTNDGGDGNVNLPGQVVVDLQPGDAVFYDSNIVHRGVYSPKPAGAPENRLTLHGSVGLRQDGGGANSSSGSSSNGDGGRVRATAVLQHGVGAWVGRADARFGDECGQIARRAERMRANLVAMGSGEGVGYSLVG